MKQVKRAAKKERQILDTHEMFFFREGLERKLLKVKDANEYLAAKKEGQKLEDFMKDRTPPKIYAYLQKFAEQRTEQDQSGTVVGANTGGSNTLSLPPDVQSRLTKTNEAKTKAEGSSIEQQINEMLQGDRYKIHRTIGKGGMGAVYEATDNRLGCRVALKNMLNEDKSNVERFVREARITAGLRHPNIITVTDIGQIKGKMYYAMTFVESCKDLSHVFKELQENKTAYAQKDLLRMCHSICNAMEFAHEHEVIHRDLKPANVMVDQSGQLYVMDWGLAKKKGQKDEIMEESIAPDPEGSSPTLSRMSLTENGITLGSPMYMPGEQAEGSEFVDERSDIYCVGAILYELMTLDQFRDITKGIHGVLKDALENNFENPRRVNKELDPQLESIILKALAKEKADRYQSFQEFGDDIKRYLDGEKVTAHSYSILEKAGRFIQKHPTLVATGALAALVAIAGSIGYTGLASRARTAEREKEKQEIKAQKEELKAAQAEAALSKTLQEQLEKAQKRNKANEKIWLAERALKRRNLEDAIEYFTEAIQEDKSCGDAYFRRGIARNFNYNSDWAVEDLLTANQKSIEESKKPDYRALYSAAMTRIDLDDDMQKAIDICKKIPLDANSKETYVLLIRSLLAFGKDDFKKAEELAKEVLSLDDTTVEAWSFLSHLYGQKTTSFDKPELKSFLKPQEAIDCITKALSIEPENIRYQVQELHLLSAYTRNNNRVVELADKLIKIRPKVQFFYKVKALAYGQLGKLEEAIETLNTAEEYDELDQESLVLRGTTKCTLGKYQESIMDLNRSISMKPSPEAHAYKGRALVETGNYLGALQEFDKGFALNQNYGTGYLLRGLAHEKYGKIQDALNDFETATSKGDPRGLYHKGRVFAAQGKNDEAEKAFKEYVASNYPDNREIVLNWLKQRQSK